MTRINTNVSSLIAQTNLSRSNDALQTSLTRLSTGLRINTGKDDPAGLIASESLRADITAVQKGISNSQQANQIISTADSALGQVSSLLNDIRGLVSESANSGALSDAQIQANQLQVDSSLQAIDRISQSTSFQGRRLLDGSLDFVTSGAGTADTKAAGTFGSAVDVAAAAAIAGVTFTAKTFGAGANQYSFSVITGAAAGAEALTVNGGGKNFQFTVASGATTDSTLIALAQANATLNPLFTASAASPLAIVPNNNIATVAAAGGVDGNKFILTAVNGGTAYNNVKIDIVNGNVAVGAETASFNAGTNVLTVQSTTTSTASQIISAITTEGHFTATLNNSNGLGTVAAGLSAPITTGAAVGSSNISNLTINEANFGTASQVNVNVTIDQQATQGQLTYSGATITQDLALQLGGDKGFNTFNFGAGTKIADVATAINQLKDATGVSATADTVNNKLILTSNDFGSKGFVSATALSGTFTTKDVSNATVNRSTGTDVQARINGIKASGDGLNISLNTPTLNLTFTVNQALVATNTVNFNITGGGANFQLGPDVVSNQQARLGIQSVSTAILGGSDGKLFELKSGGDKALATDSKGAALIVDETITGLTTLRGRLGAFQKTQLDTNIATLSDTLSNLTDAQSAIRDTDFAAESANLTRAQILVQAGTQVLQLSNQRPQSVLSLLRGA